MSRQGGRPAEVDVPAIGVIERARERLKSAVSTDDLLAIWHHVGKTIASQLNKGKGVRIERLGTFTLGLKGEPLFVFSEDFLASTRLRALAQPSSEQLSTSTSNASLNYAQVSAGCKADRNVVEKAVKAVTEALYQCVQSSSGSLTILPMAELYCAGQTATCRFYPEYLAAWEKRKQERAKERLKPQTVSSSRPTPHMKLVLSALQGLKADHKEYRGSTARSSMPLTARTARSSLSSPLPSSRPASARSFPRCRQPSVSTAEGVVTRVRRKILERGGSTGIRGLATIMRIMDDNGDKKLSKVELKYGLANYGLVLSEAELQQVMDHFDRDRNGTIDMDEFYRGVRGEMNQRRRAMVDLAFNKVNVDGSGQITVEDLVDTYDVSWHPSVKNGTLTKDQALRQFLAQWDRGEKDGIVTKDEFVDYMQDLSASIDDDSYFELMVRNAYRISGGEGQAANTANLRVLVTHANGRQTVEEIKDERAVRKWDKASLEQQLQRQGLTPVAVDVLGAAEEPTTDPRDKSPAPPAVWAARLRAAKGSRVVCPPPPSMDFGLPSGGDESVPVQLQPQAEDGFSVIARLFYTPPKPLEEFIQAIGASIVEESPRLPLTLLTKRLQQADRSLSRDRLSHALRDLNPRKQHYVDVRWLHAELAERYGRDRRESRPTSVVERVVAKIRQRAGHVGLRTLARTLSIFDNNGDKKIAKTELKFGLEDYGVTLNLRELDDVFAFCDRDKSGSIDFDEFVRVVKGEMSDRRKDMVYMAFRVLDKDGSGQLTVDDLLDAYDPSWHPAVKSGALTKEQALKSFLAQWDRGDRDGIVTREEFLDYMQDVSASIDSDVYFELMIRNAYRKSGGEGQAANTANLRVLVTRTDGSQAVEEVKKCLGLNARDIQSIKNRLAAQNICVAAVDAVGAVDTGDNADERRRNGGNREHRMDAATRLQAAFRSHHARQEVDAERRKLAKTKEESEQAKVEQAQMRNRVSRPALKTYYGF